MDLGPIKIKPTLVGFGGDLASVLSNIQINSRNPQILTMKIRQILYLTGFF